ncbi:MAG TPA: hypothetical protein VD770_05285, partial [Coxiellaceae bacterium]|nr:hypothetical protein [Coxiellaceae bacterium]
FRLGQLYEEGEPEATDRVKACEYYLEAAQFGHSEVLAILDQRVGLLENTQLEFKLAEFYLNFHKSNLKALPWYIRAADRAHVFAAQKLKLLAENDKEFAFQAAQLYEPDNPSKAFHYYVVAMCGDHSAAKEHMETLIQAGNPEAQYAVACGYYHHLNDSVSAINLCLKAADQGHVAAQHYLSNTDFNVEHYLHIAAAYETGAEVSVNLASAIKFYEKAYQKGDKSIAPHIAELYLTADKVSRREAVEKACEYYIEAIKDGYFDILLRLNNLVEMNSPAVLKKMIALYRLPFMIEHFGKAECDTKIAYLKNLQAHFSSLISDTSSMRFFNSERGVDDQHNRVDVHDPGKQLLIVSYLGF